MAPEAIGGKELDARSDLFAAGVVFHELLTARPLFAQKNEYQTLLKVQRGEVAAPSSFNEGVPKEIDDIVLRALAKEPDDRWDNAAALRDALVTVRMARQLSATPRDVQTWCDWAFSLDIGGFSGRTGTEAFRALRIRVEGTWEEERFFAVRRCTTTSGVTSRSFIIPSRSLPPPAIATVLRLSRPCRISVTAWARSRAFALVKAFMTALPSAPLPPRRSCRG